MKQLASSHYELSLATCPGARVQSNGVDVQTEAQAEVFARHAHGTRPDVRLRRFPIGRPASRLPLFGSHARRVLLGTLVSGRNRRQHGASRSPQDLQTLHERSPRALHTARRLRNVSGQSTWTTLLDRANLRVQYDISTALSGVAR